MENIKTNYRQVENKELNGIELYFDSIPTKEERDTLKENGYRWHNFKKCWYRKKDYKPTQKNIKTNKKEIKRNHSLKVGDILESSWGYEQTNNSFFRVEKLVGATMVVLREVYLRVKTSDSEGFAPMAEDRCYDITSYSYVEDEKPITRKVKNYSQNKEASSDFVAINSFMNAYKYNGEKLYCSWYY